MGKRNSNRKNAAMLDSDDDNSSISSSSTLKSDRMNVTDNDEVEISQDTLLDEALDALYEKRGSTREKALQSIIDAFNSNLLHDFVEKKFATLLDRFLNSVKKGSGREIALASHAIGLLALSIGYGDNAREVLDESVVPISQALKSGFESSKIASLMECLSIVTFVGGTEPEETERAMQIMWQFVHPKLGSNVVGVKLSPPIIAAVVSAWSFLLSTVNKATLNSKDWLECISFFSSLLDKDDRSVRIAAGEALAVIFETGSLDKFDGEVKVSADGLDKGQSKHIQGLRTKILNQVRGLSVEAAGKGSNKKDLNTQRNLFKDFLDFLEDGYSPETSQKVGGDLMHTSTWSGLVQLNFLKHFLGGGFVKHMQENDFLKDFFGFTPKLKKTADDGEPVSNIHKRMFKSPNSAANKARTRFLNKQRMQAEGRNFGHFAANAHEDA